MKENTLKDCVDTSYTAFQLIWDKFEEDDRFPEHIPPQYPEIVHKTAINIYNTMNINQAKGDQLEPINKTPTFRVILNNGNTKTYEAINTLKEQGFKYDKQGNIDNRKDTWYRDFLTKAQWKKIAANHDIFNKLTISEENIGDNE